MDSRPEKPDVITRRRPEILAPAGDADALTVALQNGADAVYFGVDEGFNARARAANFSTANLPSEVRRIHRAGARAYLALNTLIFEPELEALARIVAIAAEAGVDALIVQDPAVALIARRLAPDLEVHASTQMTISSAEGAAFARGLGVTRIVVPRELSTREIRALASATELELEVFVHGALCVAWSGQCLTSEAWGGRSANRGQCAQSCRMPYRLEVDGKTIDLGDVEYLLSPKDLAGFRAVGELMDIGVHGLKIEGRQKGPQYVATATRGYRNFVDRLAEGGDDASARRAAAADLLDMSLSYTRGFSDGFLSGSDHQNLVEGRFPKHRGVLLGRVVGVDVQSVIIDTDDSRPWTGAAALEDRPSSPRGEVSSPLESFGSATTASAGPLAAPLDVRPGMGVVFDDGNPEDKNEPGGPIFTVDRKGRRLRLGFGRPGPDLDRVRVGQRAWVTNDPRITSETKRSLELEGPHGRNAVTFTVAGRVGEPLEVTARTIDGAATDRTSATLAAARGRGLDASLLEEKLCALGGTPFRLEGLDASALDIGLHVPVSELKEVRRRLVEGLERLLEDRGRRRVADVKDVMRDLERGSRADRDHDRVQTALLVPLVRSMDQLEAVIDVGLKEVELDWMEVVGLRRAVLRAREAGLRVIIATLRVQKPLEEAYAGAVESLAPDGVLVRHWGALIHFSRLEREHRPTLHGDFSLNVTNSITARHLFDSGLDTVTASFDLDDAQLRAMAERIDRRRLTVVLHHRIPTFHTEHCVYSHVLSAGRDFHSCGRPCETHRLGLQDSGGRVHPIIVDAGCRNTVFNGEVQTAAHLLDEPEGRGFGRFRVEFVREDRAESKRVLETYSALLAGRMTAHEVAASLGTVRRFGVSATAMTTRA